MIILTAAQADQVRGLTVNGHALAPSPLVASGASNPALNGMFALPETCLNDPAHQKMAAFLKTLPVVASINSGTQNNLPDSPVSGSDWSQDLTLIAACTYSKQWSVGKTVQVVVTVGP